MNNVCQQHQVTTNAMGMCPKCADWGEARSAPNILYTSAQIEQERQKGLASINPKYVGGTKHDQGKPDFTYISIELMEELAKVRAFGSLKYSRDNWKKGFKVTRSLAAALRHIFQFLSGQTNDPESGLGHLGHAVANLEHAIYDLKRHPENDDREVVDK